MNSAVGVLGWAAFLACSWTWCIGMFLPILMVRDYGPWGFVVFAVPNVLGAAAMGWVLSREQSVEVATAHRPALVGFSGVTVAFHFFFAVWLSEAHLLSTSGGDAAGAGRRIAPLLAAAAPVLAIATWFLLRPRSALHHRVIAGATWITSALALGLLANLDGRSPSPAPTSPINLALMAPVVFFGFLFCPYMDATFHRVRGRTSLSGGRAAFTIGFALLFAPLVVGTLLYRPLLAPLIDPTAPPYGGPALPLAVHIMAQLTFTVLLHALAMRRLRTSIALVLAPPLLGLAAGLASRSFDTFPSLGMTSGELVYRLFMAFYGLVFPAYAWICMLPLRRTRAPDRFAIRVCAGAIGLAAPFYWFGFIERRELFLVPGLAIVVLARLLVLRRHTRIRGLHDRLGELPTGEGPNEQSIW